MSFITGLILIDAPASALNNLGGIEGERYDNASGVKLIKTREGVYPYVSAQALRYWLRETLESNVPAWQSSPIFRDEKIAYTDGNPILYWDDDLFGYMRAESKKESARAKREAAGPRSNDTPTTGTLTRVAPFRVGTLVSIAPAAPTMDFGTMTRAPEGDPVPHEHQFYRTTLKGLFSLDLASAGTFSYRNKTGFRNLDEARVALAQTRGLEHLEEDRSYRLSADERATRAAALFKGFAQLQGGAKLALHYTDVSPALTLLAATKGGNHIFNFAIGADARGLPRLNLDALADALTVHQTELLSPVYVGWVKGYLDEQRESFEKILADHPVFKNKVKLMHPRLAFQAVAAALRDPAHAAWLA